VRILGVDVGPREHTLVLLDEAGRLAGVRRSPHLPEVAAEVGRLSAGDPFLLGVNLPVVVPGKPQRPRTVDGLIRRRFGFRTPAIGRGAPRPGAQGPAGDALLAGLATAGHPCLPYPDRDRRRSGLAETYPGLTLKVLLWSSSRASVGRQATERQQLLRAYATPAYRAAELPARAGWAEQVVALDLALRSLAPTAGFDLEPAREALAHAENPETAEHAAALFDAALIAGMARRYLETPADCLFFGDQERGYVILPADAFVRRLASETRARTERLFPQGSLRERLGSLAKLRSVDLFSMPGRGQRLEATFQDRPGYEFDNLDEMLWWKHTRHLAGPHLPTDGLCELVVFVDSEGESSGDEPLKLVRSRHRTLSFRFEPPGAWRSRVHTRDGRTYAFHVLRAVYETRPS
jgi:hypothetical protein